MTDIDPIAIIGVITTVVGIIATYFATNARAIKYLTVVKELLEIGDSFFKGDADKIWSNEEDAALGKAVRTLIKNVQNNEEIPAEMNSLNSQKVN
jgi:hypothetical protein